MTRCPVVRAGWLRAAAVAVVAAIALSGCQSRAGIAAVVGNTAISDSQLQRVVAEGVHDPAVRKTLGPAAAGYSQLILGRLVKHTLIAGAARKLGVKVSDGQVDQAVTSESQRLGGRAKLVQALAGKPFQLPAGQVKPFLRDILLLDQIGQRLISGVTFSDADLKKFYDTHGGPQSGQTFEQLKAQAAVAARQELANSKAQAYVLRYLHSLRVRVNPRYGRLVPSRLFDQQEAPVIVTAPDDLVRERSLPAPRVS
ncbi:MAG: SurA N-terminal domain-containing protein [Actinomycetota bacterium]|nr:SurA N-terminal domain-containing protein [Actinomycetota bacterium]